MPEPTPEAWAQIRHDYEHTDRPIVDICAEHGITDPMLRYRVKRWEWKRRKPLIPRNGPPPVPAMARESAATPVPSAAPVHSTSTEQVRPNEGAIPYSASEENPPHPISSPCAEIDLSPPAGRGNDAAIVPRLQSAMARVLSAIEATIARLAGGSHHPRDMEQAGRALSALTRTLRELNAHLTQHNARLDAAEPYDDIPEDIDTFRERLAQRIEAFVESQKEKERGVQDSALG